MFLIVVLLLAVMTPARAAFAHEHAPAHIYLCMVDGKRSYGDQPCPGQPSVRLDVAPAPPPDPHLEERLRRQKAVALQFEQQRSGQTGRASRASRASALAQRRCAKLALKQRWMEEDINKVMSERREATRTRAQRHRQTMALECPA